MKDTCLQGGLNVVVVNSWSVSNVLLLCVWPLWNCTQHCSLLVWWISAMGNYGVGGRRSYMKSSSKAPWIKAKQILCGFWRNVVLVLFGFFPLEAEWGCRKGCLLLRALLLLTLLLCWPTEVIQCFSCVVTCIWFGALLMLHTQQGLYFGRKISVLQFKPNVSL